MESDDDDSDGNGEKGGKGWISCGNIDSSSLSPSNLLPGWSSPPKLRRISKCSLFIVGSLPIVRLSFSSQMSTFSTRYVGAILARHCHCIFINEGNVLKATNGNELINEILICITFKVERMGKVNKLITVAANELKKYLSVKDFGKNSRMNCSSSQRIERREVDIVEMCKCQSPPNSSQLPAEVMNLWWIGGCGGRWFKWERDGWKKRILFKPFASFCSCSVAVVEEMVMPMVFWGQLFLPEIRNWIIVKHSF